MTKSILSQLSIIMTSSFDIVSPPRIRGGIRQVSGGPPRVRGEIRVSRGGIESGQGGLRKIVRGGERAGEKPLDCAVPLCNKLLQTCRIKHNSHFPEAYCLIFAALYMLYSDTENHLRLPQCQYYVQRSDLCS